MGLPPAARRLARLAVGWALLSDFVPLYALYALFFADAGMSDAQISALFAIWSVAGILAEVPTGALADRWSRRNTLACAGLVQAAGYAVWILAPGFTGFAAGFVLWSIGGSMVSGAFEALLFDGLLDAGAADEFGRVLGWVRSASLIAQLPGAAAATVLFAIGGFPLVAWVSVGCCLAVAGYATLLPEPARSGIEPDADAPEPAAVGGAAGGRPPSSAQDAVPVPGAAAESTPAADGYLDTLRAGLREAVLHPPVRVALLTVAALTGVDAFEEYIPLIAEDWGVAVGIVPLVGLAITLAGAAGAAMAGAANRLGAWALTTVFAAGVLAVAAGAAIGTPVGMIGVGIFYGLHQMVMVVGETRLQQRISGPARATVTSVAGLATEVMALAVFAAWALGGIWWVIALSVVVIPFLPGGLRASGRA